MEVHYKRSVLCKKLSDELKKYKEEKLSLSAEEIFNDAYEIDAMIRIYEILVEMAEIMNSYLVNKMLMFPEILNYFYRTWMNTEDSSTDELTECIERSLFQMNQIGERRVVI